MLETEQNEVCYKVAVVGLEMEVPGHLKRLLNMSPCHRFLFPKSLYLDRISELLDM